MLVEGPGEAGATCLVSATSSSFEGVPLELDWSKGLPSGCEFAFEGGARPAPGGGWVFWKHSPTQPSYSLMTHRGHALSLAASGLFSRHVRGRCWGMVESETHGLHLCNPLPYPKPYHCTMHFVQCTYIRYYEPRTMYRALCTSYCVPCTVDYATGALLNH